MVIVYRDLDDKYFKEWYKMFEDVNIVIDERDERIVGLYEEIERDLMVRIYIRDSMCLEIWYRNNLLVKLFCI